MPSVLPGDSVGGLGGLGGLANGVGTSGFRPESVAFSSPTNSPTTYTTLAGVVSTSGGSQSLPSRVDTRV